MLKWARRTRLDVDEARREIEDIGSGLSGTVRIGIIPTAAQFLLPRAVRQLIAEAPEIKLQTIVGLSDLLHPKLRTGELDMTIETESEPESGITSQILSEDPIVVAASASHEIFLGSPVLKDLCAYRWVLQPPGAPTRDWLDQTFERRNLPRPDVQIESSMLLMLPTLIAETGLLSFISRHHLRAGQLGAGLKEVNVKGTTMRRRMVVTYRDRSYLSPASHRLIALLATAAKGTPTL
ncbi:LysR substrate-binding domain-containing protein [Variovorax sp. J22R115]|uniref:LysR substrate-binding domain-containing protein n=1 Tax=Variovorax sp. J22R115 TaxID=3053509 RepID=UPI002578D119|nr:LysR substrate-binding domain-containing protein [Variovorax sp. J22R115]MDM0050598.1 LysR substrate-binding domain-containing protein [Variovorax sp. J22R115]